METLENADAQAPEGQAVAAAVAEPSSAAAIVRAWFDAHIANSPLSRSVECVNHLIAKLPLLIEALEGKAT